MLSKVIEDKINAIEGFEVKLGESAFKGAADSDYSYFHDWMKENNLGDSIEKTKGFLEIMDRTNGLNFNGLFVYSIDQDDEENSIYENNDIIWDNEEQKDYLFFGDDSISWYCLDIKEGDYCVLDKPSGDVVERHKAFFDMFEYAFKNII
jgi:hypothetical protein